MMFDLLYQQMLKFHKKKERKWFNFIEDKHKTN